MIVHETYERRYAKGAKLELAAGCWINWNEALLATVGKPAI
jgi:hypothetical protein